MDAFNHADQMRLANLINDNSDDAEIQKKIDQVVELTRSTRDQAAVALHDCHYDVGKAVNMILEGEHVIVENQWKSAGKKKNKSSSQSAKATNSSSHNAGGGSGQQHHNADQFSSSATNKQNTSSTSGPNNHKSHHISTATPSSNPESSNSGSHPVGAAQNTQINQHRHPQHNQQQQQHHQTTNRTANHASSSNLKPVQDQFNTSSSQHDASDSLKNLVGISSSNLINTTGNTTTPSVASSKVTSLQQQQQQPRQQQQQIQRGAMQLPNRRVHPQNQRSTRIPDSAVEMPHNELQVSSLNIQFGELDLQDGGVGSSDVTKGSFQDASEPSRLGRPVGLANSHSTNTSQDDKSNRQLQQQHIGKGGPRKSYNNNYNNSNNDDRKFFNNSNRAGRQPAGNQRPYNQRPGPMSNNSRGVRTILNRGIQTNPTLTNVSSNQPSSGFPSSIDTWTNSTAEAATKTANIDPTIGVGGALRTGQWSDVTANEDWSEEDWDSRMETKVFTPSTKANDGPVSTQKNQPLLTDASVSSQMNLASKLSESAREEVKAQKNSLNTVNHQQGQSQQSTQKPISHMNDIFDATVAKAVLEQQNLAAMQPKTSVGMSQFNKDSPEAKTVLDQQNLNSIKPKTTMSMSQYNKEASESLKSLVGISSAKGNVPSVPPGALPLMSQPQYIMGNAYQPAIFPYAYQTPDVHYQVAAPTTGREQNFQSVYSPSDANKFSRGSDGDAPSINTTQAAPVASQTHNQQAFVTNALHTGYQLTYAMPGAFNMMPQNLYSAAPIFPHIPQPSNTGSANSVYPKNTAASYQPHSGYSAYDPINPLIQDYVKQQQQNYPGANMQQQQPTSKSSGINNELDVASGGGSYNMYASMNKGQTQGNKQTNYNESKGYQHQMSGNGPQQHFGFLQNSQQPSSISGYSLSQTHGLDSSNLNTHASGQQQLSQHNSAQRGAAPANSNKYYPSWN